MCSQNPTPLSLKYVLEVEGIENPNPSVADSHHLLLNFPRFVYCSGEFTVVNRHLLSDLVAAGLWTPALKNELLHNNGSVQRICGIPEEWKQIYKTVWEIKQRTIVDMAADRGAFIDQSQSLNVHMENVSFAKLTSLHFYAWKKGLKTGLYYLRTRAAADAIQFTVDKSALQKQVPLGSAAVRGSAQATKTEPSTKAEPPMDGGKPCRSSSKWEAEYPADSSATDPECGSSRKQVCGSACLPAEPLTKVIGGSPTSVIGETCERPFLSWQLSATSTRLKLVEPSV